MHISTVFWAQKWAILGAETGIRDQGLVTCGGSTDLFARAYGAGDCIRAVDGDEGAFPLESIIGISNNALAVLQIPGSARPTVVFPKSADVRIRFPFRSKLPMCRSTESLLR